MLPPFRARHHGLVALILALASLTACMGDDRSDSEPGDLADRISVSYEHFGEPGVIDQALTVSSAAGVPVVVEATLEPLDASGDVVPDVEVSSVFGAMAGGQVIVPGETVDFLVYAGPGAGKVRDVRLVEPRVRQVDFPRVTELVDAVPLDERGHELDYPEGYAFVALQNPNAAPVTVGVVAIVWDNPAEGRAQQALKVIPLSNPTEVEARGDTTVEVTPRLRGRILRAAEGHAMSLKAFFVACDGGSGCSHRPTA